MLDAIKGPVAICPSCGWKGRVPNFASPGIELRGVTFDGVGIPCPHCGQGAQMVSGTYDLASGVLRMVRESSMTREQIARLQEAAKRAKDTGTTQDAFLAENPDLAPIILVIVQRAPKRDWTKALAIMLAILSLLQTSAYHAEDMQHALKPPPSIAQVLSSEQAIATISAEVARMLHEEGIEVGPADGNLPAPEDHAEPAKPAEVVRMSTIVVGPTLHELHTRSPGQWVGFGDPDGEYVYGWLISVEQFNGDSAKVRLELTPEEASRLQAHQSSAG